MESTDIADRPLGDEKTLRDLIDAAPDALVVVDERGEILLVNAQAEALFGYRRDEIVGRTVEILVPGGAHGRHAAARAAYLTEPRARPMGAGLDLLARRKDGTEFPAEISLSPLETARGLLVSSSIRDVSERRRLEKELRGKSEELEAQKRRAEEATRRKSEFLAGMSHELRTPLNGIIGFAELMLDGKVGPVSSEHAEYLGDILTSARHLLQLLNDVLDLARVESGRMDFRPERVDPATVVEEVCDVLRPVISAKQIRVETSIEPLGAGLFLDPGRLRQVLYNYVSNALKFTAAGGRVAIRVRPEGPAAFRLEVEDEGIGIRRQDLGGLFVEFQQPEGEGARRHHGAGLGLALTRRIVEAQGGRVGVESEPGIGSRFYATLPRVHGQGGR